MKFDIDASELNALGVTLAKNGAVGAEAAAVVKRGALNVKNDAREAVKGRSHLPLYADSIGFDIVGDGRFGQIEAIIGPDKEKPQGALGNIIEYGTSERTPPIPHLGPALDREGPRFEDALAALAGDVFR